MSEFVVIENIQVVEVVASDPIAVPTVVGRDIEVVEVARQGPPGLDGSGASVEQSFTDESEVLVNHNLGHFPTVSLMTLGGVEIEAEVVNNSINQLTVYFVVPMSGHIRCA